MNIEAKKQFLKGVGEKIRQFRDKSKISQEELAGLAELHRNYMGRIERGQSNPPIFTVHKIAKALGVSFSDLTA